MPIRWSTRHKAGLYSPADRLDAVDGVPERDVSLHLDPRRASAGRAPHGVVLATSLSERAGVAGALGHSHAGCGPCAASHAAAIRSFASRLPYLPPSRPLVGTDEIGRDLLSRVIIGIRLTWLPRPRDHPRRPLDRHRHRPYRRGARRLVDAGLQRLTELFLVLPSTLIALAVVAALGPASATPCWR